MAKSNIITLDLGKGAHTPRDLQELCNQLIRSNGFVKNADLVEPPKWAVEANWAKENQIKVHLNNNFNYGDLVNLGEQIKTWKNKIELNNHGNTY